MVRGGHPLLRENLAETDQPSLKTPISNQYTLVAPQSLHLAKKVKHSMSSHYPLCRQLCE